MQPIRAKISPLSFCGSNIGLEKEGLRVTDSGSLSISRHPEKLGATLTHPCITTDFAESQLELITSPETSSKAVLGKLKEIETFTRHQLGDELIWSSSMPCRIDKESDIQIAQYGNSSSGLRKTIYRRGLAHRYGKSMQIISGMHFNYSFPERLWKTLQEQSGYFRAPADFIDNQSMAAIRNIHHLDWILVYLFGASPAVDQSFPGVQDKLQVFKKDTYFLPYATSLRMSDMGYSNNFEQYTNHRVRYDSLQNYISSLQNIVSSPHPFFSSIPLLAEGKQQQLNHNLLQIENEHYTTVRPKQTPLKAESSLQSLQNRGIGYIEIRSLDINPFQPCGIELRQLHFMEIFMHLCLLNNYADSDSITTSENSYNLKQTASQGRNPALKLIRKGQKILLTDWAESLFDDMSIIAQKLDQDNASVDYTNALTHYYRFLKHPELTPSAEILSEMDTQGEGFVEFTRRLSLTNHQHFLSGVPDIHQQRYFEALTRQSIIQQHKMECNKTHCYACEPDQNINCYPVCQSA